MIVRLWKDDEVLWAGELEALLSANQEISTWQRKQLRKLEPGQRRHLYRGYRVERPETPEVPVIPPVTEEQLDFEKEREAAWETHAETKDVEEARRRGELDLMRREFDNGFAYGWSRRGDA